MKWVEENLWTVLQVVGFVVFTVGVALWSLPLALVVSGAITVLVSALFEYRDASSTGNGKK